MIESTFNGYNDIKQDFENFILKNKTLEEVIDKTKKATFNTINKSLLLISKEEEQFNENFKSYKTINKFDKHFNKKCQ